MFRLWPQRGLRLPRDPMEPMRLNPYDATTMKIRENDGDLTIAAEKITGTSSIQGKD